MSYYGDDDIFDDEMGFSRRASGRGGSIEQLLGRKSKLEARLLGVSNPVRKRAIQARINRINRILSRVGYYETQESMADAIAASGVEGVGGLMFQAEGPPGLGRLVRLPFYPTNANAGTLTSAGIGAASTTNPVCIELPASAGATVSAGQHIMQTPQISWATLRIVGFETQQKAFNGAGTSFAIQIVSDLQIGGGANLFTHEDFGDATIYDADQPEFAGLRDYPLLVSPNRAQVTVQETGLLNTDNVTFSCALLCEVLIDQNYGAHVPGPYARRGAMVRQGGSFVR
jgi:hypothetical protein